jgi:hypothetical protein
MALESLSKQSTEGCLAPGIHTEVIQGIGTTERQLKPEESGSLVLLDAADQITVRLPTPVAGMTFTFLCTVSVTSSDTHKVITKTIASEFMVGGIMSASLAVATSGDFFVADGATHVAITQNGSTTGGLVGGVFTLTAISATQWGISGVNVGSGTNLDPFATS